MVRKAAILFICLVTGLFAGPLLLAQGYGNLQHWEQTNRGLTLQTDQGILHITFYRPEVVRIDWDDGSGRTWPEPEAVVARPEHISFTVSEKRNRLEAWCGQLEILIEKKPLSLAYYVSGRQLTEDYGYYSEEGMRGFRFSLDNNEHLYGTGERALPLDRRGQRLELDNQPHYGYAYGEPNLNYSIPLVLSSKNYILYFDNPARGIVDLGKTKADELRFAAKGGPWRYYLLIGNRPDELMKTWTWLTGRQPMPPRWALGNLVSRFGYRNEQEVWDIVDRMQKAAYPMDAVIIDLYWFGKGVHDSFYMGNLAWDTAVWHHPARMIRTLEKRRGVKTILITEPFILQESANFVPASARGILAKDSLGRPYIIKDFWFGLTGLIDIFKPEARDWFWQFYRQQAEIGVAGWWGDLGEPEKHPGNMIHVNGTADEVHNIYGHIWNKMLFDKYAEEYPDQRLFNLNRSGFAGSQRFGVFPWSGDVSRSWSGLRAQLPIMLGMSQSGIGYMHSDLGGFAMGTKDEELYTRWMQFGTFTPIYRPHGSGIPSEPVFFNDTTQRIVRQYINLRYALMPYNYTLAWRYTTTGMPLATPLSFREPENEALADIEDEYYWGREFLVAPVLEKGVQNRKIYLPEGQWVDFFNDRVYAGEQWINYPVSLENIPVFVRAGSFIPEVPVYMTTAIYNSEYLDVHFYPSRTDTARFTMYEDDGHTNRSWEQQAFELLHFTGYATGDGWQVDLDRTAGWYENMPAQREMKLLVHNLDFMPEQVRLGNEIIPVYEGYADHPEVFPSATWDPERKLLAVAWFWDHQPLSIRIP